MRREVVVGGARLENVNKSEAMLLMFNRGFEDLRELSDVPAESACDERRFERKDEVHRVECVLGDTVRRRIHGLLLPCERTRLPEREAIVRVVVEHECDGIVATDAVDEVADAFGKTRAVAAKGDYRQPHVGEFGSGSEGNNATVKAVEAIAFQLIRAISVTSDIEAHTRLMRMESEFHQRTLHRGPDPVITAAVAPSTLCCAMEVLHSGATAF